MKKIKYPSTIRESLFSQTISDPYNAVMYSSPTINSKYHHLSFNPLPFCNKSLYFL